MCVGMQGLEAGSDSWVSKGNASGLRSSWPSRLVWRIEWGEADGRPLPQSAGEAVPANQGPGVVELPTPSIFEKGKASKVAIAEGQMAAREHAGPRNCLLIKLTVGAPLTVFIPPSLAR